MSTNLKSHLTAITRRTVSKPMVAIDQAVQLAYDYRKTLDYGCGRGYDAKYFCMDKYDPHYFPEQPVGPYDLIVCNYVLNVIESVEQKMAVIRNIQALLADDGCAYITVRNDYRALNGCTGKGTWQDATIISGASIFKACAGYVTYVIFKGDDVSVRASIGSK